MCLGIPGRILDFHPADRDLAVVDVGGGPSTSTQTPSLSLDTEPASRRRAASE